MATQTSLPHIETAKAAGLEYVTDAETGIHRKRVGRGWAYYAPSGALIRDRAERRRLNALAIPPAWTDVWICANPNGHLQVTARDKKGRKQYRYHPRFREKRDESKFGRMLAFSEVLPRVRQRVERDLRRRGLPRDKVLATVVWLLERTFFRVGNVAYTKHNRSYGLTTLRRRHVQVKGSKLRFEFRGKSGVMARAGSCGRPRSPTAVSRGSCRAVASSPAWSCSSTWTTMVVGRRSTRTTSTSTCGTSPGAT
jgi:DNA topoisomerase-1